LNSDANRLGARHRYPNDRIANYHRQTEITDGRASGLSMGGHYWSCQPCPDCILSHAKLRYPSHHNRDRKRSGKGLFAEHQLSELSTLKPLKNQENRNRKMPRLRRTTVVEQKLYHDGHNRQIRDSSKSISSYEESPSERQQARKQSRAHIRLFPQAS